MKITSISRTVGSTQVVDEFIMSFTHDAEIDWLLPGVKPTGKYVEIPMLGVIQFRGSKLCHEHIYWDHASVLVQIGLLDPTGLPVAGVETARKLLDEDLPSNIVKLLYYSYKIRKTRNNSSTESINHSLRLRLTHAHICSIGFKSGLYAGSQRILCPCCSNNS